MNLNKTKSHNGYLNVREKGNHKDESSVYEISLNTDSKLRQLGIAKRLFELKESASLEDTIIAL